MGTVTRGRGPGPERWWRAAAAVPAGALPALAFPAPALWWFAYVALVPWMLLVRGAGSARRAAREGWLGGLGLVLALHHWLLPSLHVFLLPLAALLGLLWIPWALLVRRLLGGTPAPRRAAAALVLVPAGWLLPELARSWQGLGGPWGLLGASQWQVAPALRLASVGGVWLVSLLVVAVNCAVLLLITVRAARAPALAGLTGCAVLTGAVWLGAPRPQESGRLRVAVVQPGPVADGADSVERRFALGERLTRQLAGQRPDLVVWGESSVGADLAARPDLAGRLAALAAEVGAPLLVNVDARRSDRPGIYKSSVLVGPEGPTGDRYDKMRLVPFGEYVPARSVLGWATAVGKAAGEDRRRGGAPVVMTLPGGSGARIGPLVCFESAFPDMSRRLARDGAALIVVQSATSTFQDSWAPAQHASLAALRAAETGRPVVHATLTGTSAGYGPAGERVAAPLPGSASTAAVYELALARGTTFYVRHGDWAVGAALAALAAYGVAEGISRRSLSGPAPERPAPLVRTARGWPARRGR
ncbi:apolipoprotein N-acyltransferase [Streptomyces antimicrobicus]|uniref:Apolipoprotein N-acyltransferase n=1 Tax=Streptomyces antimicrobicus TaxID=2883108 RepID=A0ABS8BEV3_9ACTN|nr:apolipoprotein N-acyltransferase [Streptomyces antimicrobicus]MCB5183156.1 apolipoprotein N-acyltransferase [Streptomyces antimicrobicus]